MKNINKIFSAVRQVLRVREFISLYKDVITDVRDFCDFLLGVAETSKK